MIQDCFVASGGRQVYVSGSGFNSVQEPVMLLRNDQQEFYRSAVSHTLLYLSTAVQCTFFLSAMNRPVRLHPP